VTIDAMCCQCDIAKKIMEKKAITSSRSKETKARFARMSRFWRPSGPDLLGDGGAEAETALFGERASAVYYPLRYAHIIVVLTMNDGAASIGGLIIFAFGNLDACGTCLAASAERTALCHGPEQRAFADAGGLHGLPDRSLTGG
jgi:hypothetical protein